MLGPMGLVTREIYQGTSKWYYCSKPGYLLNDMSLVEHERLTRAHFLQLKFWRTCQNVEHETSRPLHSVVFYCYFSSQLNARRTHFDDDRAVHQHIPRVAHLTKELVPTAKVHMFGECVHMAKWAMDKISQDFNVQPISICPSGRAPIRRPRFLWLTWDIKARRGTRLLRTNTP